MFTHQIRTERALFTWLNSYMLQGKKRMYPAAVVEWADQLLHRFSLYPGVSIDLKSFAETMDVVRPVNETHEFTPGLAMLLEQVANDDERVQCSERVIVAATGIYEALCKHERMKLPYANRRIIMALGIGYNPLRHGYFEQIEEHGARWLVGTPRLLKRYGLQVRLSDDPPKRRQK